MANRRNTLKYNWSDKHIDYMRRTQHCAMNIAEGSIRSGKTTDNVFCFAHDLKRSKDKLHLATASTQPTAKVVIGDCDGYGLEHIFRGQCKWGKYKGNECLRICGKDTNYQEKIVLFCGGAKADSYKKFRGMSIGLWIATEINLHHPETIREAQRRQINADIKRFYWDLNPEGPGAAIYREFIDQYEEKNNNGILRGGFNLQRFNIFDNINLSSENRDAEISKYTVGSVWYMRDILGERCAAEGAIYTPFLENEGAYYINADEVPKDDLGYICIGQDFGGHKSKHTFCATGISRDYRRIYVLRSEEYDAEGTSVDFVIEKLDTLCKRIQKQYGFVDYVFADSAEQTIINSERQRLGWRIRNSVKNPIVDRIRATDILLTARRMKIVKEENDYLIAAMRSALWDAKAKDDTRLDVPGVTNICPLDAFEYSWEYWITQLSGD